MRAHLGPLALFALVPVFAASCGGGSSKPKTAPRLTQKQFVAAANKVCIASDRRIFRLGALSIEPGGWAKTATAAKRGVNQMRAVRPPVAQQAAFETFIRLGAQVQQQISLVHKALVAQNYARARAAQKRATDLDTKVKLQARKLGLTFCEQLLTNWPA